MHGLKGKRSLSGSSRNKVNGKRNGGIIEDPKVVSDPMLCGQHIAELNCTNDALVRACVWGLDPGGRMDGAGGVGALLTMAYDSTRTTNCFPAYDGNGNLVALVSADTGTETACYEYGLPQLRDDPVRVTGLMSKKTSFRFSTKRTCNRTDLVLCESRAYSPGLGRWLSRDPIGERGGLVLYIFAANCPVNAFDCLGLTTGKCREAVGENGKPGRIFGPPPPKGGWRGRLWFGDFVGSAHAQMMHEIGVKWEASVVVLSICPAGCELRAGVRIKNDKEEGTWLVYDPGTLPLDVPIWTSNIWELIGESMGELILEVIGPVPVSADEAELESAKATIRALIHRRPWEPWDGSWRDGQSPCT